jgi:radical SAM superfamily enzyme YgiQ (UPF0313 family)
MKLLFVNPSLRLGSATKYLPVGIGSVMTYLDQAGYKFDLLDVDINDFSDEYVENYIATNKYDVVLTGSIVTHYKWMKWLVRTIKKHHPSTKVIVGNSVAGSIPELFLRNSTADVAIIGEGEFTCLATLNAWRDGKPLHDVEGIGFIDTDGKFIKTPRRKATEKLDELPLVNWDFFDVEAYFERSYAGADGLIFDENNIPRTMPVASARGCVFRCSFCHFVFWDDPYRHRSPENIMKEIRRDIEKYGVTFVSFWDDLSFASLKQVERMVDAILESGLKFHWNAAIRTDLFGNPKHPYERRLNIARKMRESGCVNVGFSLESGNQEILNMMNKHVKAEYFREQVRCLNEAGISSSVSVVFGYPIENEESIRQTFDQCLSVGIYPSMGYLLPLPYTGMYDYAKEHGFITDENAYLDAITERQDFCLNMTTMPRETIEGLIKDYAQKLNDQLKLGLAEGRLLKTGGYMYQRTESANNPKPLIDPDNLKRNQNDFSLNYSQAVFRLDATPE